MADYVEWFWMQMGQEKWWQTSEARRWLHILFLCILAQNVDVQDMQVPGYLQQTEIEDQGRCFTHKGSELLLSKPQ